VRHVVGRFDVIDVRSLTGSEQRTPPLVRAANRVRRLLRTGAEHLSDDRASLFTGLVYGDDSAQPPEMTARFRESGLAHLTAVSGQNVVFVLTMAGPLLSRMRRPTRVGVTVTILAWFAILTRLEPSVVRAVTMAGISAVMVAAGRPVSSWLALCTTVVVVSLVDPFLIWSIGWWLSVSGCVGLIVLTPAITRSLQRWPQWARSWMAPTIAAQTGVLGVVVVIFGWPSALAVPCNLLATPVAGLVMLMGMPLALVSGVLPRSVGSILMWPIGIAVGWVDQVALVGSRLDPPGAVDVIVSVGLVAAAGRALIGSLRTSRRAGHRGEPDSRDGRS
jgi:competence protein ComEC